MRKADLVKAIMEKSGLRTRDADKFLNAALASISEALCQNEKVSLQGFGTFETRFRKKGSTQQLVNP